MPKFFLQMCIFRCSLASFGIFFLKGMDSASVSQATGVEPQFFDLVHILPYIILLFICDRYFILVSFILLK